MRIRIKKLSNSEKNLKKGYIRLHRSLLDWEWYDDINVKVLFLHCLLRANYEDKEWHGIIIPRGSFLTSYSSLSSETGLTYKQVRFALDKLKLTGEVAHKGQSHYSIITVKNWNEYQIEWQADGQTIGRQLATDNKIKNIKTTISSVQKNKNATPPNKVFKKPTLEEVENYIKEKNLSVDGEKFFNYYESIGWKVGRNPMKSWQSALNYWQRTEKKEQNEEESWAEYVDRVLGGNKNNGNE